MIRNPNYLLCISSAGFFVTSYYGYLQQSKLFVLWGSITIKGANGGFSPVPYMDMSLISGRGFSSVVERIMKGLC